MPFNYFKKTILKKLDSKSTNLKNAKLFGANGDDVQDDRTYFSVEKKSITDDVFLLDKATILKTNSSNVICTGKVKWKDFTSYSVNSRVSTGIIPVEKLNDEIYTSMTLPPEPDHSFMINTDNKKNPAIAYLPTDTHVNARTSGAFTLNYDKIVDIPSTFTLCIGSIKLFILNKSGKWIIAQDMPYPKDMKMFSLPWIGTTSKNIDTSKITWFDDHVEIALEKNDVYDTNNIEWALHFWSRNYNFGSGNHKAAIAAYEVWVKEPTAEDCFVTSATVDFINANNDSSSIKQGFWSQEKFVKTKARTFWGHNIKESDYDNWVNSSEIMNLWYNRQTKNLSLVSSQPTNTTSEFPYGLSYVNQNGNLVLSRKYQSKSWVNDYILNPYKQLSVPYAGAGKGGYLCKLFTFKEGASFDVRIHSLTSKNIVRYGQFYISAKTGVPIITILVTSSSYAGMISVAYDGTSLYTVYVKTDSAYRSVTATVQILNTSDTAIMSNISFDTDLFNYSGYTNSVLNIPDKWIDPTIITGTITTSTE